MRALLHEVYRTLAADGRKAGTPRPSWSGSSTTTTSSRLRSSTSATTFRAATSASCRSSPRPDFARAPRVYAMALDLIRHSDASLNLQRLTRFVASFQAVTPLTIGELWAWPVMLKVGLVENLRRLAAEILADRNAQAEAVRYLALVENLRRRTPTRRRCRPSSRARSSSSSSSGCANTGREPLRIRLEERLAAMGIPAEDAIRAEHQHQSMSQVSMANSITSLRLCCSLDWSRFFERVSVVEEILRSDPAAVYARMDFKSRDRYRHAIEELAQPTAESQKQRRAPVHRERAAGGRAETRTTRAARTSGYHLIGKGRPRARDRRRLRADAAAAREAIRVQARGRLLSRGDRTPDRRRLRVGDPPRRRGPRGRLDRALRADSGERDRDLAHAGASWRESPLLAACRGST